MFRRICLTALVAGVVAGLFAAALQRIKLVPLIERAEVYEAAEIHAGRAGTTMPRAWQPEAGFERAAYTVLADLVTGIGFALLLTGAIALAGLRGHGVDAGRGLLWGAAGFAVFTLAPALSRQRFRAEIGRGQIRFHAAATAPCHCAAASARKVRSVDRETRCR